MEVKQNIKIFLEMMRSKLQFKLVLLLLCSIIFLSITRIKRETVVSVKIDKGIVSSEVIQEIEKELTNEFSLKYKDEYKKEKIEKDTFTVSIYNLFSDTSNSNKILYYTYSRSSTKKPIMTSKYMHCKPYPVLFFVNGKAYSNSSYRVGRKKSKKNICNLIKNEFSNSSIDLDSILNSGWICLK